MTMPAIPMNCGLYTANDASADVRHTAQEVFADLREVPVTWQTPNYEDQETTQPPMERPAFQRLCADIEAGLVQVIVTPHMNHLASDDDALTDIFVWFADRAVAIVSTAERFCSDPTLARLLFAPNAN